MGVETDVRALDGDAWRARLAWVPQVPFLFPGSVADNVRLAAPDASDAEVAEVLARVGLADVPPERTVGERGRGLSSGQRRRVGIARALLRRAPFLLLDEPTAGLDEAAEAAVLAVLRDVARGGAGVLVVAHRPGAVAEADRSVAIRASIAGTVADPAVAGAGAGPAVASAAAATVDGPPPGEVPA